MKATFVEKQDIKVKFQIEYTAEEFEEALIKTYRETKNQFHIDGFRKGKAPRKLIMQRYGAHIFDEDAVEGLLQKDYPDSLLELGIEPIDKPEVSFSDLKHGEGFTITIEVDTPPEFDVKDYEGVKVKSVSYPVLDEDVEKQLEQAQDRGARLVTVERGAQDGDTVNIDYSGTVNGEEFQGGSGEGHNLKLGSGSFIEGFEEQLAGKKTGDEVDVSVTVPEDYHAEELAGKEAVFAVRVNEVRSEEKPELNDEFAQDISEFDTLDELREDIRAKLEKQGEMRAEMEMKDAILEKIYKANDIEAPEVMVAGQLEDMLKEFEQGMRQQGVTMEQYFQLSGQTPDDLRERMREDALKRVRMKLIIQNIARLQGLTASDEELDEELENMAEQYGAEKDKMSDILGEFQMKLIRNDIINRKAVDHIYSNAIETEETEDIEETEASEKIENPEKEAGENEEGNEGE